MTLWLLAGQIPLSTEAELPGGQKVYIAADQLTYEPSREALVARGQTTLKTDQIVLRADELVYDQKRRRAVATGNVMVVSGMFAAIAESITIDVDALEAWVEGGLFLKKKNVTQEQLLAARTPHELKKTGETELTITGSHFKQLSDGEFLVDGLTFTPCDCDPTEPTWRVEAASANVEPGERAILNWPVVYVQQVPVFAVPWLYLPLSDRRTGLLMPKPTFNGVLGTGIDLPFFLTLGESYDLTLTPGLYSGFGTLDKIKVGRLQSEFRYSPSPTVSGRASLGMLYDGRLLRDPTTAVDLPGGQMRGFRGDLSLQHNQDMGGGWKNRIDAGFVSDGFYFSDITADVLARQSEYLRSTGVIYHQDESSYAGLEAVVRQPIYAGNRQPFGFSFLHQDRSSLGDTVRGPETFARFPAIVYAEPERQVAGPLNFGFRAEYARLAPVMGSFGDEGSDGVFTASDYWDLDGDGRADGDGTQGNRLFDVGEREARNRVDFFPRVSATLHADRFAYLQPYAGWRETLYLGEVTGRTAHRGYLLAGAEVGTELTRTFGDGEGALRHRIGPRAETRVVPFVLGGVPGVAYDAIDAALPLPVPGRSMSLWQTVAELRQSLEIKRGNAWRDLLRLDLGQGWDHLESARADTWARLALLLGPVTTSAAVRYDLPTRTLAQITAALALNDGRGNGLSVAWDSFRVGSGGDNLRAGIDALVGRPLLRLSGDDGTLDGTRLRNAEQIVGGFWLKLPASIQLRYDAVVQPLATRPLQQQRVGLSYGPGCDCWRVELYGWVRPDPSKEPGPLGGPFLFQDIGASLIIREFGAFGTGG